jgi:hypothetical protein
MFVHDMEKKTPAVTETPLGVSSGDVTPVSAGEDVVISDADKKLEAMGYTPVTTAPTCKSPETYHDVDIPRSSNASSPPGPASALP